MKLQSFKGTPDSLKQRFKGSEKKLSLGAPAVCHFVQNTAITSYINQTEST